MTPQEAVMTHAARRFMLLAGCLGVTVLAGCAAGVSPPAAGGRASAVASQPASPMPLPADMNVAAFNALARQEARDWPHSPLGKAWKTRLVIPAAEDLTSGPVRGFASAEAKEAFGNGNLIYTGPPPSGAPAGFITWGNGSKTQVPVLSEAQVFSALKNNDVGRCPGCRTTPLAVTGAQPTTMVFQTSQGYANIPAWAFTVEGAIGPVLQAAIPPPSYVRENSIRQPTPDLGPLGQAFAGTSVAIIAGNDDRTLDMALAGSPCGSGATWGGLVAEVGDVVVVGGWIHNPHAAAACPSIMMGSQVSVRLAAPLGNRVILDAASFLPAWAGSGVTGAPVKSR